MAQRKKSKTKVKVKQKARAKARVKTARKSKGTASSSKVKRGKSESNTKPKAVSLKTAKSARGLPKPAGKGVASKSIKELVDLTLVNRSEFELPKKFLVNWVNSVAIAVQSFASRDQRLQNLSWAGAQLTIAFLDTAQARELNRMYREKDYATDVLSFGDTTPGVLGELAICPEIVELQAREHGLPYNAELGYMVLHGILHLLGFDHENTKQEEELMFDIQDSIFEGLKLHL